MRTGQFWIDGPWPGRLAVSPRPRGGDWLADEIGSWKRDGIDVVLSLLTHDEEESLDLSAENEAMRIGGLTFLSLPIPDRQTPGSESELTSVLEQLNTPLESGKNVLVHCRQGVGRSGLVAACLLIAAGLDPAVAVNRVSAARGVPVPETEEQRKWIDHYAAVLSHSK